jgi:hypothetical protein
LLGRRKFTEVTALPFAMSMLAYCVLSRRCIMTSWLALSTITITTFQLFCGLDLAAIVLLSPLAGYAQDGRAALQSASKALGWASISSCRSMAGSCRWPR